MFNGIRNYVSDYDFFDLLPLKNWGYKHFGIDLIVDEIGSKDEMLSYLSQHATDTYQDFINGGNYYEYKWKTIDVGNTDIPNGEIDIIDDANAGQIDYATMLSRRLSGLAYKVDDVATFKNGGYQDAVVSLMNIYGMARDEFGEGISKAKYEDLIRTLIYTYLDYRIDLSGSDNNADTVAQVVEETVSFITGATFNHETNTFDNTVYEFLKYIVNHAVVTDDDVHYDLPLIEYLINGNVISTIYPEDDDTEYSEEERKAQRLNFYNNYLSAIASETGSIARSMLYGFVSSKLPKEYEEIFKKMLATDEKDMPLVDFVDEILKIVLKDSESSEQLSFEQLSTDGIKNLIQLGIEEISNSSHSHKDELVNIHGEKLKTNASQLRDFLMYTLIYDNKQPNVQDDIRNIVTFISQISKLIIAHVNEIYLSWMKVQQEDCTAYFDHRLMHNTPEEAECENDGSIEYYHLIDLNVDRYFKDRDLTDEINKEDTIIKALGHDWNGWEVVKKATLEEEGLEQRVCKNNLEHIEQRAIPKIVPGYSISVDPDHIEFEATEGYEELSVYQEIDATSTGTGKVDVIAGGFKDSSSYENFGLIVGGMSATLYPKQGLVPGTYTAVVVIEDLDDRFSPVEIPVTFIVTDSIYKNTQGNGNIWYKGSNKTSNFTFENTDNDEITYDSFIGIKVDGNIIDKSNYNDYEGSVVIELLPSYLETLSIGNHTITALFKDDMSASANFTILSPGVPIIPKTGIE